MNGRDKKKINRVIADIKQTLLGGRKRVEVLYLSDKHFANRNLVAMELDKLNLTSKINEHNSSVELKKFQQAVKQQLK